MDFTKALQDNKDDSASDSQYISRPSRSLADLTSELNVEYIKPADLAGARVNLISARLRVGKYGEECVYGVQFLDGTSRGCTAMVSLKANLPREKLVTAVNKYKVIGPVMLTEVGEVIDGNRPWGFVDATVAPPSEQLNALPPDRRDADPIPF